jgi:hypothetical protein
MADTVKSRDNVSIRLTDERWSHIVEEHCELAGMRHDVLEAVASPERILSGTANERLAVRTASAGKLLVVVYRENPGERDGFVITAFLTKRARSLERRPQIWPENP